MTTICDVILGSQTGNPIWRKELPTDLVVRAKWVKFVRKHRPDFKDLKCAALCSAHFEDDCCEYKSSVIDTIEQSGTVKIRGYIKRTAEPTRDTVVPAAPEEVPSNRTKREVSQIFVILRLICLISYAAHVFDGIN